MILSFKVSIPRAQRGAAEEQSRQRHGTADEPRHAGHQPNLHSTSLDLGYILDILIVDGKSMQKSYPLIKVVV